MEKRNLGLCGNKNAYIERMYEYVFENYSDEFNVFLFTKDDALSTFLKGNKIHLLIKDEEFDLEENKNIKAIALLSDNKKKKEAIYKYNPCDMIVKQAIEILANAEKEEAGKREVKEKCLIGVYTPIKRSFQTTFSVTLGQILSKENKTLYLNFETYSGFESLCRVMEKRDIFDLLYFSECGAVNFGDRIDSMKERIGNLDYISPAKTYVKYSEIYPEQWNRLLTNIMEKTNYKYVILDLSEQVNGLLDVLKRCDRVYTITDEDKIASAKVAQYTNMLKESAYEEILDKTENITIPKFREIPSEFEMLPYSEFATYIKKIVSFDNEEEKHAD